MKNFGINLVGVPLYQTGTPKNGIQHSLWTSEDYDPVMYKKVRPVEEQKKLVYKNRQDKGIKNFDKGFKTLWGVMRLHPTTALGTDIMDAFVAAKNKDADEVLVNTSAAYSRVFDAVTPDLKPKSSYKNPVKYGRAKAATVFGPAFSWVCKFPDIVDDTVDLYNTVVND